MSTLDIIYFFMLVVSIPLGHLLKNIPIIALKKFLCLAAGLVIIIPLLGLSAIYHSFLVIVFNYAILKYAPQRFCHFLSFFMVFGYLLFFRSCGSLGFQAPPKHSNAVQLLVTLRMVSLAFEKHETMVDNNNEAGKKLGLPKDFSVTFMDTLIYGYCYIGLMTGPFYTYQTFQDMLHQDGRKIKTLLPALRRLKLIPIIGIPYLYLKEKFPMEYLESVDFLQNQNGFIYSLVVVSLTAAWFRWRFYIGWMLAESSCITASLGAYPIESEPKPGKGPTVFFENMEITEQNSDSKVHSFQTIENIGVIEVEFAATMKQFIKNWNKTVQWWLSSYATQLYSGKSKTIRTLVVFTVSCFWHGTYSGYYFMGFMVALYAYLENRCVTLMRKIHCTKAQETRMSWLLFLLLPRFIDFVIVPFMLLQFDKIIPVWSKLYYFGFFLLAFLYVLPHFFTRNKNASDSQSFESNDIATADLKSE